MTEGGSFVGNDTSADRAPVSFDFGFPITNVGNDKKGVSGMTEGGLFVWERGMLINGFFRRMDILPQAPFSLLPQGPLPVTLLPNPSCHSHRPLPVIPVDPSLSFPQAPPCHSLCHSRRPLSVIPAVFSGNPSFSRVQSEVMTLRQGEHDR